MTYFIVSQFRVFIEGSISETALLESGFGIVPFLGEDELNQSGPKTNLTETLYPSDILVYIQGSDKGYKNAGEKESTSPY